jgi:hypothetical protein
MWSRPRPSGNFQCDCECSTLFARGLRVTLTMTLEYVQARQCVCVSVVYEWLTVCVSGQRHAAPSLWLLEQYCCQHWIAFVCHANLQSHSTSSMSSHSANDGERESARIDGCCTSDSPTPSLQRTAPERSTVLTYSEEPPEPILPHFVSSSQLKFTHLDSLEV